MNKLKSENNSPKISIIIPCYNQSHYLTDAVKSILSQTFQDFEIIIVNDGSTDCTQEVCKTIVKDNVNFQIHLINQENSGLSAARNAGILLARGEYVLPLDADDKIALTMLEECIKILEQNKFISIVYTDRQDFGEIEQTVVAGEFTIDTIKYFNQISYCSMYRKSMWKEIGGYKSQIKPSGEDWDFWVTAASKGYIGFHIHKPLFKYRRRSNGLFQEVNKSYEKIFAQIILNNLDVYSQDEIEDARNVILYGANTLIFNISARLFYKVRRMEKSNFWKIRTVCKNIYLNFAKYFNTINRQ